MKRLGLVTAITALGAGAVLLGAGCGGDGDNAGVTVTVTEPAIESAPAAGPSPGAPEPSPDREPTYVKVGQPGKDGTITFRVLGSRQVESIPLPFDDPIRAPAGAKLIAVRVTWRNDGKVRADPFCGQQGAVLIDQEGRNFDLDTDAVSIEANSICEGVQPGFRSTEILPFIIPADAQVYGIALWDPAEEDDLDARTYVRVEL